MGAKLSNFQNIEDNSYLNRFVSLEVITPNNPFWNQLLSFSLKIPSSDVQLLKLEESLDLLLRSLIQNNSKTGNILALIKVYLRRATELNSSVQLKNDLFVWQTCNALFILRCIIKSLLERFPENEAIALLQVSQDVDKEGNDADSVELMVTSLVEILVDLPLSPSTYFLHLEASNAILTMLSSHILSAGAAPMHIIFRMLLVGKPAIHACLLVKVLLNRFILNDKEPARDEGGSIILGLASGIWNVLTLGLSSDESQQSNSVPKLEPLANSCVLLLLALAHHGTNEKRTQNPYRTASLNAQNFHNPKETPPTQAVATFKIEFSSLYNALIKYLHTDQATLLFYTLLHKNSDFRTFVLSRTDIEKLVLPIIRTLYHSPTSTSHHIYMSLIVLLMLSEDDSFNKVVHDITVTDTSWYMERTINQISLGGILVLVVIRTITFNMTKIRDKYLHTNCLAALANMSHQFRNLHQCVCDKLVNLFETLARRHSKLDNLIKLRQNSNDTTSYDLSELMSDFAVIEEVLRMVLEIINSTLTNQLSHNHNLLYTLLYRKHIFDGFSTHSSFEDITQNIQTVVNFLMRKLEQSGRDLSVKEVQEVIRDGVLMLPADRLKKFPELKFRYVEESDPEEFFVPYIWKLIHVSAHLGFNPQKISLFDTNALSL